MSQFIKSLAKGVVNHIENKNFTIYVNNKVVYNKNDFSNALLRCTGETFGYTSIDKFVDSDSYLLALVDNISNNSDRSFSDMVYILTCIANRRLLKNECELNAFENLY